MVGGQSEMVVRLVGTGVLRSHAGRRRYRRTFISPDVPRAWRLNSNNSELGIDRPGAAIQRQELGFRRRVIGRRSDDVCRTGIKVRIRIRLSVICERLVL